MKTVSAGLGLVVGHPAEVGNRASNHFACRQLREKGHCVVSVPTAACGADDSKVSFGIKSNYQVGTPLDYEPIVPPAQFLRILACIDKQPVTRVSDQITQNLLKDIPTQCITSEFHTNAIGSASVLSLFDGLSWHDHWNTICGGHLNGIV